MYTKLKRSKTDAAVRSWEGIADLAWKCVSIVHVSVHCYNLQELGSAVQAAEPLFFISEKNMPESVLPVH